MESELQKYRRKKELEQKKQEIKVKVQGYWDSFFDRLYKALLPSSNDHEDDATSSNTNHHDESDKDKDFSHNETDSVINRTDTSQGDSRLTNLSIGLMTLTWLLFYIAFLKIEFGAVYFTISLLLFVYWNTATTRRRKGEASAYSVFNKDCQSIDGTLKPEHLEKQLLYRS